MSNPFHHLIGHIGSSLTRNDILRRINLDYWADRAEKRLEGRKQTILRLLAENKTVQSLFRTCESQQKKLDNRKQTIERLIQKEEAIRAYITILQETNSLPILTGDQQEDFSHPGTLISRTVIDVSNEIAKDLTAILNL